MLRTQKSLLGLEHSLVDVSGATKVVLRLEHYGQVIHGPQSVRVLSP